MCEQCKLIYTSDRSIDREIYVNVVGVSSAGENKYTATNVLFGLVY